ncbi:phosphate signaling complex protein PhoU [Hymenobacter radiodurans]|uniref:phosphate signaling complex protein PhoU n=1 Tax=Hymenobacter radiodurans TaxID=2496028 RepID=UPI001058B6CE|nr:phosphate signaling complex protein PhoU [Hymenobacter radiodurans]
MAHLALEIQQLKQEVHAMWGMVLAQLQRSQRALHAPDPALVKEVSRQEKRINTRELKIERHCESIIALHTPVAIDLRFVLAVLKINTSLERVGDAAKAMAQFVRRFVLKGEEKFDPHLLAISRLDEMCREATMLLEMVQGAFEHEDSQLARRMFREVKALADNNVQAHAALATYIQDHPGQVQQALQILLLVRKLDRIGDEAKNIAEEIIFYLEAQVLRHQSGKHRGQ